MPMQHYYMGTTSIDTTESNSDESSSHQPVQGTVIAEDLEPPPVTPAIATLLALPEITVAPSRTHAGH